MTNQEIANKIIEYVIEKKNVDVREVNRNRHVVQLRAAVAYSLRNEADLTLTDIGNAVDKNHATILHYIKNVENYAAYDSKFKDDFWDIRYKVCKMVDTTSLPVLENMLGKMEREIKVIKRRIAKMRRDNKVDIEVQIEKIISQRICDKCKIDELLELDTSMHTYMGTDSTPEERQETRENSIKIYNAIREINVNVGQGFLDVMDM
jgi:hypothetical protein